jgi:hypothetical protein
MEGAMNTRVVGIGHNQPPLSCVIPGQPWPEDAQAVIVRRAQPVITSGRAGTDQWVLRFEQRRPQTVEPLMGWTADDLRKGLTTSTGLRSKLASPCLA